MATGDMRKEGISPKMQRELDKMLLDGAASSSQLKVKQALQKGANVNGKDDTHWTALHIAAYFKNLKICKILLEAGAKVDPKTPDGTTPLFIASSVGSVEVVELFLKAGASANAEDSLGRTPLMGAADQGSSEIAILLLQGGANPTATSQGKSALDFALEKKFDMVAAEIEAQMLQGGLGKSERSRERMRVI